MIFVNLSAKMYDINSTIRYRESLKRSFFVCNPFSYFTKITNECKKKIEKLAFLWREKHIDLSYQERFYCLLEDFRKDRNAGYERKLATGDETFLFLLLAFDPTLAILRISLDSSEKEEYMNRVKEEFSFFPDSRILTLEKFYNERFSVIEKEPQMNL